MMIFAKKTLLVCTGLFINCSMAFAGPVEQYLQHYQEKTQALLAPKSIQQSYFNQLIDHNNTKQGTFAQRYYIDETYSSHKNDPVLYYICGEATCTKRALSGAIRTYAKKHHAKMVALEHRYYGQSLPTPTFSTDDFRFLTTEAALDDLAYFQRRLKNDNNWTGKWVAIGGSYPGSLSAYYRLKFPYLVAGSLASSAPVMAKEDFAEYDAHVTKVAGPQCAAQMRQAVSQVEATLNNPAQLAEMKALFAASEVEDSVDFLYLIADTGAAAVQYGMRDAFCKELASDANPLKGYASFAKKLYIMMDVTPVEMTVQGAMNEDPAAYKYGVGMRQWYYQSCTEYGYWQNANQDPALSTRSALINLDYHRKACERLYGLHQPADTASLNNTLYYPLMDELVSNIYFTNGSNDPWSTLSLTEDNGNAINAKLTYHMIEGAAHCDDLHTPTAGDSESLIKSREIMDSLLTEWLK